MTASLTAFKPGSTGGDCLKYYEDQRTNGEQEDYYLKKEGGVTPKCGDTVLVV